jgi:release factor glutamine methyltransferase
MVDPTSSRRHHGGVPRRWLHADRSNRVRDHLTWSSRVGPAHGIEHHAPVGLFNDLASITNVLQASGCVAAGEEAEELMTAARGDDELAAWVERRRAGEPLAWITGHAIFCGLPIAIESGVYVPRWQSEPLAALAARLLPPDGRAVDLCTGSGAVAMVMQSIRPGATVVATEIDPRAAACARRNGLVVYEGHLDQTLPRWLKSQVDVMTGVLPYVPSDALHLLPRDVQRFEPRMALDGGEDGLGVIRTAIHRCPRWLKPGGWLALEIGGDQAEPVTALLVAAGFGFIDVIEDGDGDLRGVFGQLKT